MKNEIDNTNPEILKLVRFDDPLLRTSPDEWDFSNSPVDPFYLARQLHSSMMKHGGIGLSATQVGLPYRVFVMRTEPIMVCFNPRIRMASDDLVVMEEGCLSWPGLTLKIARPSTIRCVFQTPDGQTVTKSFNGMSARVFQHEMCHMEGREFFEELSPLRMDMAIRRAKKHGFSYTPQEIRKALSAHV